MVNSAGTGYHLQRAKKIEELLVLLENGKQADFFNQWETIVPNGVKSRLLFKHLTFYAHVYFIVHKIKLPQIQQNNSKENDLDPLDNFKNYLWNNGTYFSSDVEFTPYFVLPFVRDLENNKMFSDLFEGTWESDFKERLKTFLNEKCNSFERPEIEVILYNDDNEHDFVHWKTQYNNLRKKFRNLYEDSEVLTGVVSELIKAIQKSVLGEEIDLKKILSNCYKIKPSLFNENLLQIDSQSSSGASEVQDKDHLVINDLDIEKIKSDLLTASIKTKLLILQALRWGITKSNRSESSSVVWLIVNHDVLHLITENCNFIEDMISPSNVETPHPTQQSIARLINAVATVKLGQSYLASGKVIELFVNTLRHSKLNEIDDVTVKMLTAILQKFSWMHDLGELMIKLNLIEWLVIRMIDSDIWNYELRQSLLLLMSLTRYPSGRQICIDLNDKMVEFSSKFLSGGYQGSENCESIFWKFCAFLENTLTKSPTVENWQCVFYKFTSSNIEILCKYFNQLGLKEESHDFDAEIDANDPLKVEPNGITFLGLNYRL